MIHLFKLQQTAVGGDVEGDFPTEVEAVVGVFVAGVEAEKDRLVGRHILTDQFQYAALPFILAGRVGELADDDAFGPFEEAALLQRQQHPVKVVHPFVHVFDEEDAVFVQMIFPRGAEAGVEQAQVAADQPAAGLAKATERMRRRAITLDLAEKGLAERIEKGRLSDPDLREMLDAYISPYRGRIDGIVSGCTHYPLIRDQIVEEAGGNVPLFDGAEGVARECAHRLAECAAGTIRGVVAPDLHLIDIGSPEKLAEAQQCPFL